MSPLRSYTNNQIQTDSLLNFKLRDTIINKEKITKVAKDENVKLQVWDKEGALARFDGSIAILGNVIKTFLHVLPLQLKNFENAVKENNLANILLHVHSIKGSAADLRAIQLQELADMIELDVKKGIVPTPVKIEKLLECSTLTLKEISKGSQQSKTEKMLHFSKEEIIERLTELAQSVRSGEFVDSDTLNVFDALFSQHGKDILKTLKHEIDIFDTDAALVSFEKLIRGLK